MAIQAITETRIVKNSEICGGQPYIDGTRIKVQQIAIEYEHLGWSPDQICDAHPNLILAAVHDALAYYYGHKVEIDSALREDEEFVNHLRGCTLTLPLRCKVDKQFNDY